MNPVPAASIAASELRHRLRTPLNHLIGYSEILIEEYPRFGHRIQPLLHEANVMLDAVQQTAGGDQSVSVAAIALLKERLADGVRRVQTMAGDLIESMPSTAHADLGRIAAAANMFWESLDVGTIETFAAPQKAVIPPPREFRPEQTTPGQSTGAGRILVVDDNELNRDMLSRQLEKQQHHVATAGDGETALAMLRTERYDIVLLDLMMPGMNGFEVLGAIRNDTALSGVAVILISALDEMDSVVRSIEAGAADYLFKPVNPTLLRARIKSTLDKLRADEAIRRKQRLESIGLLAAGIAHDFNNLLTGIIGNAQLLQQVLLAAEDREMADSIVKAGERAAELTRQLLAYSGKAMSHMQPVDLASLIRESERLVRASLPKKVRLELRLNPLPAITADQNQLRQALLNLTLNAAEAIGPDCQGSVILETGVERIAESHHFDVAPDQVRAGKYAWLDVRDTGCGMDTATVGKIFEPFFTTKFLGRGLGLAAVAGIIRSHNGLLRVRSAPGDGSSLRMYFPLAAEEQEHGSAATAGSSILVVDDEAVVRQIVKLALERAGRHVLLADSGEAAVDLLRRNPTQVELVVLDWKMPVMDGSETLVRLREIRPDLKVIVSSGFAQSEAEERFAESGITGYLQKPYRMSELAAMVNESTKAVNLISRRNFD
jgi:DNA-binding response OmpR family regulator